MATANIRIHPNGHNDNQFIYQQGFERISEISVNEYGSVASSLEKLFADIADLYAGKWSSHEACQVTYHNLEHAIDVSLAVARMISGWNQIEKDRFLPQDLFVMAMAAAFFHDSGYIKDKGDHQGHGGKFTLIHVDRSCKIASEYLTKNNWPLKDIEAISKIISITDYSKKPELDLIFSDEQCKIIGQMVATADLVAQMADIHYLQRIDDLFAEFQEVYQFEKTETLAEKGTKVYSSVQEIKSGTISFYEHFVVPTLRRMGRMDRYLTSFFGDGRNPYQENIAANLSCHLMDVRSQWRRIGDVLEELGLATGEQIQQALAKQRNSSLNENNLNGKFNKTLFGKQLLAWFDENSKDHKCLGDYLMEMEAVSPSALANGLLTQMLPESEYKNLTAKELHFLLKTALLLQNICKGAWIIEVVMEMLNQVIGCEASSILLADVDDKEMFIAFPTGPKKKLVTGKRISSDKGLSGWVYRNGQPASVANVMDDERFDSIIDKNVGFTTRSILVVPMYVNGECVGVLEALNKNDDNFTHHDMSVLTILATMLANVMAGILCINTMS
ncbi:MAG: GAF domain-containing protein [Desulfobulbaceae bacterium]|nr:GAF domain-containing protein [Desulfobulbaceae bacterium]HIJ77805.1 GAF domain-containing protein [Deltaproteobacteria bacterium]